jgi:hypothetical protein
MAAGSRHDFLGERWGMSNFKKTIELSVTLSKKLHAAVQGRDRHAQELAEFSSAIEPAVLSSWRRMVEDWHSDPANNTDPYRVQSQGKLYTPHCACCP